MNHALKLDERAFNEGVKEVIYLRPIVRAAKALIRRDKPKDTSSKASGVVRKHK